MNSFRLLAWSALGALLVLVASCASGCVRQPRAKAGQATAFAPMDPGKPGEASSSSSVATLPVPPGSTVETVPGTPEAPAPSVKVTLSAPSELRVESHGESASSGTVDTSVAVKKAELAQASSDRQPLLWVAIVCGVLGLILRSVAKEWPALGNGFLLAGVFAGAAWKLSEVPGWIWMAVLVAVVLLVLGYKRAEWDANGDGVPDVLQRRNPPIKQS